MIVRPTSPAANQPTSMTKPSIKRKPMPGRLNGM
jgi:hypothetical protein